MPKYFNSICRTCNEEYRGRGQLFCSRLKTKYRNTKYCPACKDKGERSPLWKGGITPQRVKEYKTEQYLNFVKAVLQRDAYTCVKCGINTNSNGNGVVVKLEVHHIKSYAEHPELRFDISNGTTLCKNCHNDTKRKIPRTNRIDFIQNKKKKCVKCGDIISRKNPQKFCTKCRELFTCKRCGSTVCKHKERNKDAVAA